MSVARKYSNNSPVFVGDGIDFNCKIKNDDGELIPMIFISSATWKLKKPDDTTIGPNNSIIGVDYIESSIPAVNIDMEGIYEILITVTFTDSKVKKAQIFRKQVYTAF